MVKLEFSNLYPWQRARTREGIYYDSQVKEKQFLAHIARDSCKKQGLKCSEGLDCSLGFVFVFYKHYPVNFPKKRRLELSYWNTKPDADNLEKFMFDMLQYQAKIIREDSRVCAKMTFKLWGPYDYTIIFFDEWNNSSRFLNDNHIVGFNGYTFDMFNRVFHKS